MKLIIRPSIRPTQEERSHNRELLERYIPDFIPTFLEFHKSFGAKLEKVEINFPASDHEFIKSRMDSTKEIIN